MILLNGTRRFFSTFWYCNHAKMANLSRLSPLETNVGDPNSSLKKLSESGLHFKFDSEIVAIEWLERGKKQREKYVEKSIFVMVSPRIRSRAHRV